MVLITFLSLPIAYITSAAYINSLIILNHLGSRGIIHFALIIKPDALVENPSSHVECVDKL